MIDYNTLNIIFDVTKAGEDIKVFIPPVSDVEIKKNALVLGQFASFMNEVSSPILIEDWEEYLYLSCEKVSKISSFKVETLQNNINAMLERGIAGGYYYEGFTPYSLNEKDDKGLKNSIKASLLFFIVARRYIFKLTAGAEIEAVKKFGYELSSYTALEYGNILEKSLSEEKNLTDGQ